MVTQWRNLFSLALATILLLSIATPVQAPIFRSEGDKRAAAVCKAAECQAAGKSKAADVAISEYNGNAKQPAILTASAVKAAILRQNYGSTQLREMIRGLMTTQPDTGFWLSTCLCLEGQSIWDSDCT